MKKLIAIILAMALVFALVAACAVDVPAAPDADEPVATPEPAPEPEPEPDVDVEEPADVDEPEEVEEPAVAFPGRIAIITNDVSQNEEEFRSAEALVERYGEDKVVHRVWPAMFAQEPEMMVSIMQEIAADPEIGAVIINQAVIGTNAAIDAFIAVRGNDDAFIVAASPAEDPADTSLRADLLLDQNNPLRGETIVAQAVEMGAETIAHISFPRHMGVALLALRRDNMRDAAEAAGLNFVELVAPDPMGDGGVSATQLHITQDIPRQVEELGENTVFFATNCGMMVPLIQQVVATGAMFVEPCCPSPYHGYPTALGLEAALPTGEYDEDGEPIMAMVDLPTLIDLTVAAVADADMTGRIAGWALPNSMAMTMMGFYYAVEWLNGNVPQEHGVIEMSVLARIVEEYGASLGMPGIGVDLQPLVLDGREFGHFVLGIVDSFVY